MSENLLQFLSEIHFFSEVSKTSLQHLCNNITEESYIKNETIFEKDTIGNSMFAILEGSVKVHDKNHVYDTLSKGDCFGEYALIDNEKRSASVTAINNSRVLKIEREQFLSLIKTDSGFAQGILAVMIKRHRELDTIQERLASSKKEIETTSSKMSGLINGAMDAIIMFNNNFRIVSC